MDAVFGAGVMLQKGDKVCGLDTLPESGVIGLYFSAQWCMPCRGFTPKLAEAYRAVREAGKAFEVIYLSADKDEVEFGEYFTEQPWLAVPYSERDLKAQIQKSFQVRGIPALILLDATTGEVITKEGRQALSNDLEGKKYPWTPPTPMQAIGDHILSPGGKPLHPQKELQGKHVGFFFCDQSAACWNFAAKLCSTHNKLLTRGAEFCVVHLSSSADNTHDSPAASKLPFFSVPPPTNPDERSELAQLFKVTSYPTLIILDPDDNIITEEGVAVILSDPKGSHFPWNSFKPPLHLRSALLSSPKPVSPNPCRVWDAHTPHIKKSENAVSCT